MRTTVTLDPDVATRLKAHAHRQKTSFKAALNALLRRGLAAQDSKAAVEPFVVEPHAGGFRPGLDPGRLNQLSDELETDDFIRQARG